jgi:hypothetical protein
VAAKHNRTTNFVIAGALVGVSCWLRANALLLAPFLAAMSFLIVERRVRLRAAAAILAGAVVIIAPITIKNAIVFHRFIPLSLGAGQTLLEGIADYDESRRFNIPNTDLGIMWQEAEWYGKPEYAELLFGTDGDPVPVIAPEPPVSHDFTRSQDTFTDDWLRIRGDESKYGTQHAWETISVKANTDYVFYLPLKLEEGRVLVKVTDASQSKVLASMGADLIEGVPALEQPSSNLAIPFVSAGESQVRLVMANYASSHPVVNVGPGKLVELGPSSYQWLRYLRIPIGFVQRIFKTAWMLPLVVIGLVLLMRERRWTNLLIILMVPLYYLIVQSVLHTERRYVYIVHFFFLILAAHAITTFISLLARRRLRKPQTAD